MPVYFPSTNREFFKISSEEAPEVLFSTKRTATTHAAAQRAFEGAKELAWPTLKHLDHATQELIHGSKNAGGLLVKPADSGRGPLEGESLGGAVYLGKIFLDIQEKKRVTFGEATWDPFIVVSTRYSKHGNLDEVDQLEGKMQSLFHWLVTEEHPREVLFLYNSNDVMSKEALIRLTRTRNIKCTIPSSWSAVAPLGSVTLEYRSKPESEDLHRTNLTVCPVSNIEHLLTALECLLLPSVDYSKLMEAGTEVAEAIRGKSKKRAEGASSTHTDASLRASRRGRNVLFITIIAVSLIAAIWKVRDSLNSSLQPVSSNSQGASRRSPEPSAVAPVPLPRPSTADQLTTTTVSSARTVSASAVAPPMIQPHRRQTAGEWRTAVTGCVGRRDAVACIKRQIATAPPSCSRQVQDLRVEKSELVTYTVGLLLEACH